MGIRKRCSIQYCSGTILGQILRVAVLERNCVTTSRMIASQDAKRALLWLTQAIYAPCHSGRVTEDDNEEKEKVISAWITALAPSKWDFIFLHTRNFRHAEFDLNTPEASNKAK